jgi:pseudouridine synthase
VNGERSDDPSRRVDPDRDRVAVDGEAARLPRPATILVNKPAGVLVTLSDPGGRRTVLDLVRRAPAGLFPIGRLDRESEGLLLMTNDGDLAFRLMHPRFRVPRRYRVWVRGEVAPQTLHRLEHGVLLREGRTAPAEVRVVRHGGGGAILRMTLFEGRNREVRRMCEVVGLRVVRLLREAFGPIALAGVAAGAWRVLTDDEVVTLRKAVGLPPRGFAPDPVRTRVGRGGREAPAHKRPGGGRRS